MIMKDDKRKAAMIIIRKLAGKSNPGEMGAANEEMVEKPTHDGAEVDASPGLMASAEEAVHAAQAGDAAGFLSAMRSMVEMISMEEPEE